MDYKKPLSLCDFWVIVFGVVQRDRRAEKGAGEAKARGRGGKEGARGQDSGGDDPKRRARRRRGTHKWTETTKMAASPARDAKPGDISTVL